MKLRELVENRLEELADEPFITDENGRPIVRVGDIYGAFGLAGFVVAWLMVAFILLLLRGLYLSENGMLYAIIGSLGLLALMTLGDYLYWRLLVFYATSVVNDKIRWRRITYAYLKNRVEKLLGLRR